MTPKRKEEIREILANESRICSICGFNITHHRYNSVDPIHEYTRSVLIVDELLDALDKVDAAAELYDY